jgi:steroid delta-isomerase-like uncharacterized protein
MSANRRLLERYVELYNAGDLGACMDLYADDAIQTMPDGTYGGRREIQERLALELTAFPDATYTVESFFEQGETFADEWTFVGTHTGPFLLPDGVWLPPTGRRVEIAGMELVRVRDGKIVIDNLYYDRFAGPAQLGLAPPAYGANGGTPAIFEVAARLRVRDGELDGFKRQAAEMMRHTREKDTKTLRYDWFLSDDGTECEVREGYVDADALLEHAEHVAEARATLFRDYAYDHTMTIYGEPSPALAALMEELAGVVPFRQFSLLQGLDAESRAVAELPA